MPDLPDDTQADQSFRHYPGDGIVVHWNPAICAHSGICARGLPVVFKPRQRPWITVQHATAAEIAAVIDRCPSRALSYTMQDVD